MAVMVGKVKMEVMELMDMMEKMRIAIKLIKEMKIISTKLSL